MYLGSIMNETGMIVKRRCAAMLAVLFLTVALVAGCSRSVAWLDERDASESLMQKARRREKAGDVDSAIRVYRTLLDNNPKVARAHLDIALLLHDYEGDYVGAIYHYKRYIELRPETDKKEMIENRIRLAGQLFAGSVFGRHGRGARVALGVASADRKRETTDDGQQSESNRDGKREDRRIASLEKENAGLRNQLKRLKSQISLPPDVAVRSTDTSPGTGKAEAQAGSGPASGRSVLRIYRVRQGDTLSSIAAKVHNDTGKWEEIYEANRDALGGSTRLKVGQILVIP